jgi:hypothetical protein
MSFFGKNVVKKAMLESFALAYLMFIMSKTFDFNLLYVYTLPTSWMFLSIWIRVTIDEFKTHKNFAWTFTMFSVISLTLSTVISWEAAFTAMFPLMIVCNGCLFTYSSMNIMLLYDREHTIEDWFEKQSFFGDA